MKASKLIKTTIYSIIAAGFRVSLKGLALFFILKYIAHHIYQLNIHLLADTLQSLQQVVD